MEDNGPGIPPDVLPDIFDAFVSSRLDAKGTGLGLTVAEGIVHQHGGSISASNRAEGGACLEVALPAAISRRVAEAAAPLSQGRNPEPPSSHRSTEPVAASPRRSTDQSPQ